MNWFTPANALAWAQVVMALVTALATVALWRVTQVLAKETKRMADRAAQPHVVATLEPNAWAMMYVDLKVANVGNAAAYDVKLMFDPPLANGKDKEKQPIPFQAISILRPGQSLASFLCEYEQVKDVEYTVTVTWKRAPTDNLSEILSYALSFGHYEGMSQLENRNPLIQISGHLKRMRDDWKNIASGYRHLQADTFTKADRQASREALERSWKQQSDPQSPPEKPARKPRKPKAA